MSQDPVSAGTRDGRRDVKSTNCRVEEASKRHFLSVWAIMPNMTATRLAEQTDTLHQFRLAGSVAELSSSGTPKYAIDAV